MSEQLDITTPGIREVPLELIRPNPVSLRTVDKSSEKYLGLVQSIRNLGFDGTISCRPQMDRETGKPFLEIVNGLHRFSAAGDAGLSTITVQIQDRSEDEVLEAQMMLNLHGVPTKPAEYAEQLRRMLDRNPMMTETELAGKLGCSVKLIEDRLSLNKIVDEDIKKAINDGDMTLMNAVHLSKLPADEQRDFFERALTSPPAEFIPVVAGRVKEIKEANRAGKDASPPSFTPTAVLRKPSALREELGFPEPGPNTGKVISAIITDDMTPRQAAKATLEWVLSLDAATVASKKADFDVRMAEQTEIRRKREAEKNVNNQKKNQRAVEKHELEAKIAKGTLDGSISSEQAKLLREAQKNAWEAADKAEKPASDNQTPAEAQA